MTPEEFLLKFRKADRPPYAVQLHGLTDKSTGIYLIHNFDFADRYTNNKKQKKRFKKKQDRILDLVFPNTDTLFVSAVDSDKKFKKLLNTKPLITWTVKSNKYRDYDLSAGIFEIPITDFSKLVKLVNNLKLWDIIIFSSNSDNMLNPYDGGFVLLSSEINDQVVKTKKKDPGVVFNSDPENEYRLLKGFKNLEKIKKKKGKAEGNQDRISSILNVQNEVHTKECHLEFKWFLKEFVPKSRKEIYMTAIENEGKELKFLPIVIWEDTTWDYDKVMKFLEE